MASKNKKFRPVWKWTPRKLSSLGKIKKGDVFSIGAADEKDPIKFEGTIFIACDDAKPFGDEGGRFQVTAATLIQDRFE